MVSYDINNQSHVKINYIYNPVFHHNYGAIVRVQCLTCGWKC